MKSAAHKQQRGHGMSDDYPEQYPKPDDLGSDSAHAGLRDLDREDGAILARLALGETPASIMADLGIEMDTIRRVCALAGAK